MLPTACRNIAAIWHSSKKEDATAAVGSDKEPSRYAAAWIAKAHKPAALYYLKWYLGTPQAITSIPTRDEILYANGTDLDRGQAKIQRKSEEGLGNCKSMAIGWPASG